MTPKTPGAETILAEAVEIADPAERAAFLDRACAGDVALRQRLGRLADDHFRAGSFLEHPPAAVIPDETAAFRSDEADAAVGTQIGPYALRELLGEGGMGAVYVAEQAEPVRRKVALKVIKPGMDSKQVVARFEAERQALALMDHPNIARILDGGTTPPSSPPHAGGYGGGGRPYFVMELVRGVPITDYCDRAALTTRQRLELFVQVCAAVQHAHQKGIIHRDIKPSNVLVTLYDGVPVPKVIDFGIAKALGARLTDQTVYTRFAQMVGTPLYMSPEQAELSALDVDTRSDVYALGVLLYELLTGVTPFDRERFRSASFDEVRRIIREDEPPRPSARLSTLRNAECGTRNSGPNPRSAFRIPHLKELDWVVMKCLEKDRNRRYETASALAQDIERYLHDQPVQACPPSVGYRLQKFVRRNSRAVAAGAFVMLAIVAGLIGTSWGLFRATKAEASARDWAEAEKHARDDAEHRRQESDRQKGEALRQRDAATRNLYLAHMRLGQHDWSAGRIGRLRELLERHIPRAGAPDLRGWEWYYLLSQCHTDLFTLRGHRDGVGSVAWCSDGQRIASAGNGWDGKIKIWDADTGRELRTLSGEPGLRSVAWSPDGQWLASSGEDKVVRVWEPATGREVHALRGHNNAIWSVAWSPNGRLLSSASHDHLVKIWDATTGKEVHTLRGHEGEVIAAAWSPDGRQLATAGIRDRLVKIWDVATGEEVRTLRGHKGELASVAWSPDGRRLASASMGDFEGKVWDVKTGQQVVSLKDLHGTVFQLAWSPDGRRLALAGYATTIQISDSVTGELIYTLRGHTDMVFSVAWSPDGRRLASASSDATVKVWDPARDPEARLLRGQMRSVSSVAWDPENRQLAANGDDAAVVWEPGQEKATRAFGPHPCACTAVAWSRDGKRIASADAQGTIKLWDAPANRHLLDIRAHRGTVRRLAFSPNGAHLASAGEDALVNVWDVATGQQIHVLSGHREGVSGLAWSPDGRRLATSAPHPDGTAKIWDAGTGEQIFTMVSQAHGALAWSPDGHYLAAADREIRVWDARSWQIAYRLPGHTGSVMSLAWHPDGRRLASAGEEHTVKVWDTATRDELLVFRSRIAWGPGGILNWSPDGKRLALAGSDGVVKVWDASAGYQMATGRESPVGAP